MCLHNSKGDLYHPSCSTSYQEQRHKKSSLDILQLQRRRSAAGSRKQAKYKTRVLLMMLNRKMAMKNLKLYMQNQLIIEENERLRRKALLLDQENIILFSQLQNLQHNQDKLTKVIA